ncbi:DUF3047 domain-containing protein [Thalassococcus sp. BH17M4-6]|uniref:DUF3047 domain-containing protein n=1 Tax=Thalassococcus sp. BH17M4-6 TaxID=3413148 RepID=UPI003BCAFCFE
MTRLTMALLGALALGTPAIGAQIAFDDSWKEQRFSLFSSNDYSFDGATLMMESDGTVSLAYSPLPESLWSATSASWSWQVDQSVPATDLRKKGGDDRNLAMYFVFLPAEQARELKDESVRKLLTNDAARVLVYVWGGDHQRGDVLDSPYLGDRGKTIVLRPSGTGSESEEVDLGTDFAKAFGGTPGALVGVAVSGDSDDTETAIRASVSDLMVN